MLAEMLEDMLVGLVWTRRECVVEMIFSADTHRLSRRHGPLVYKRSSVDGLTMLPNIVTNISLNFVAGIQMSSVMFTTLFLTRLLPTCRRCGRTLSLKVSVVILSTTCDWRDFQTFITLLKK